MDHAVHAADVHESAVGGQGLDNAVVLVAHSHLAPDLLLVGLPLLGGSGTDGTDHTTASTVHLGDLHLHGLADHTGHIAALGNAGLGSGNKHPDALIVGHQAALVLLGDGSLDIFLALAQSGHVVPDLHAFQLLSGKLHGALLIVHTNHEHLNFVTHVQDILRLHGRIGTDFVVGDVACVLGTQVHLYLGVVDTGDDAGNLITCI